MNTWEQDGVGLGGQYLDTKNPAIYAGVHAYPSFAECQIWTPGCGFNPRKTQHETVEVAKRHAEEQLALLSA